MNKEYGALMHCFIAFHEGNALLFVQIFEFYLIEK